MRQKCAVLGCQEYAATWSLTLTQEGRDGQEIDVEVFLCPRCFRQLSGSGWGLTMTQEVAR